MAVIPIALTDASPTLDIWETPETEDQLRSPIPKGVIRFDGTGAVALKGTNDETNLTIEFTMPDGYVYLPRFFTARYRSDDLVENFEANALAFYVFVTDANRSVSINLTSPGQFIEGAIQAEKIWVPGRGSPKLLMRPTDTFTAALADMDAGASTAGDLFWRGEFYCFEPNQVDKWQVHTPVPIINHAAF